MVNIVLADSDEAYIDRLGNFVAAKCGGKAEVAVFTKPERLKKYLDECEDIDILLTAPEFNSETNAFDKIKMKFLLYDKQPEDESDYYLFKYKPASSLLEEMLSKYAETGSKSLGSLFKGNKSTKIITVHSARGDSGKTLISLALCIQFFKLRISTLYLNIEPVSSLQLYLNGEDRHESMTSLLYYLKHDIRKVPLKFDAAICNDVTLNIAYFAYPSCAFELCELKAEDFTNLLYQIKSIGRYDALIIDGETGLSEAIACILSHSDVIVHVIDEGTTSFYKQRVLEKEISKYPGLQHENIKSKSVYIINKCSKDKQGEQQFSADEFRIPVLKDIFVHTGHIAQLNPRGGLVKALSGAALSIAEKTGISPAVDMEMTV